MNDHAEGIRFDTPSEHTHGIQETLEQEFWLEVDKIDVDPSNQVREDLGDIKGLSESIANEGMHNSIHVSKKPDDRWRLEKGRRRLEAAKLLSWPKIRVKQVIADDQRNIIGTISENIDRDNLTPYEEARAVQAAMKLGWTEDTLLVELHRKPAWIKARVDLMKTDLPVQRLVHEGRIGLGTVVDNIVDLPVGLQSKVAKTIIERHATGREAKRIANQELEDYKFVQQYSKWLSETKYRKCPTCKKPAIRPEETVYHHMQKPEYLWCLSGPYDHKHVWNYKTGKTLQQEYDERDKAEGSKEPGDTAPRVKAKRPPVNVFRYPVPTSVLRQALATQACSDALALLKKGAEKTVRVMVDDVSVEVEDASFSNTRDFNAEVPSVGSAHFEVKTYRDGNLTKISPWTGKHPRRQEEADRIHEAFRKKLNALPEIASYLKEHEKDIKLKVKVSKRKVVSKK